MFGVKKLERRIFHLEEKMARLESNVIRDGHNCDFQAAHYRGLFDAWHKGLEVRISALAAALGYKWVPEGKTEARWERKLGPFDIDWNARPRVNVVICPKCRDKEEKAERAVARKGGRK